MDDVNSAINSIYCSTINNIDFNVLEKEIKFDLTLTDNGNISHHTMQFKNVTAFMWLEKDKYTHESYDFSKCDYYELTSILLEKTLTNTNDEWLKQYSMEYNVVVEIWETALLINTTEVIIDNKKYLIP